MKELNKTNTEERILHIAIKNKEELKQACEKIRKIKKEVTLRDLDDLPIQWDIKLEKISKNY